MATEPIVKVSDVIKQLQKLKKKHGDLRVICASDDEGNEFQYVNFTPSAMCFEEHGGGRGDAYCTFTFKTKKVNAICIN